MKHLHSLSEAQEIIKALSAPARTQIMELLYARGDIPLNELASVLHLTSSAITMHTKILAAAGLIQITTVPGKRGNMKICRPTCETLLINMKPSASTDSFYEDDIPVGGYSLCEAAPTCGIATTRHVIGRFDNPASFTYPDRFQAGVLWFGSGRLEYVLPNHLQPEETVTELQLSLELASESPGYNEDYPSDIEFYLNDIFLGQWTSPGDFGKQPGNFNPEWWPRECNQHGLLKTLSIRKEGVFIDNDVQLSSLSVGSLNIDSTSMLNFRMLVRADAANCGGLTLFGKGFGNYDQNISLKTFYKR